MRVITKNETLNWDGYEPLKKNFSNEFADLLWELKGKNSILTIKDLAEIAAEVIVDTVVFQMIKQASPEIIEKDLLPFYRAKYKTETGKTFRLTGAKKAYYVEKTHKVYYDETREQLGETRDYEIVQELINHNPIPDITYEEYLAYYGIYEGIDIEKLGYFYKLIEWDFAPDFKKITKQMQ